MYHIGIKYFTGIKFLFCLLLPFLAILSCSKSIEVDPPENQIISSEVFKIDSTAKSAVMGIYSEMMLNQAQFCAGQTTVYTGLSAHELYYFSPDARQEFYDHEISTTNHPLLAGIFWNPAYRYIYAANLCLERLRKSEITPLLKSSLIGESLFIRAFCYFHLVNLFGDVPLVLTTNYEVNDIMPRTSSVEVYAQIVADLTEAAALLPTVYPSPTRSRVNKWAAKALLARVYLYLKQWGDAEQTASEVINSGMYSLASLGDVFISTSSETILQFQPVNPIWNTWEGRDLLPASASETPKFLLTAWMENEFEADDNRKTVWVGTRTFSGQTYHYPTKYKVYGNGAPITEFYVVLRLAEQFLIRAEARAHLSDIDNGLADVNYIRQRAGLHNASASDTLELLNHINHERAIELFAEWGHRWYDLKRRGDVNAFMQATSPGSWQPTDVLYPLPSNEILLNPTLIQNPGY